MRPVTFWTSLDSRTQTDSYGLLRIEDKFDSQFISSLELLETALLKYWYMHVPQYRQFHSIGSSPVPSRTYI